jgi:putative DNA methylase
MPATEASRYLIETDDFPFEFLSELAERESWRKELHRPVYHVHKWWAKRLGSVFRGILLGCLLPEDADLRQEFYRSHDFRNLSVFDPFMGSGTTIGEAHKLGLTALGRDINPVAAESVRVALGELQRDALVRTFDALSESVGSRIRGLYRSIDADGRACDILYYFWVMQAPCPHCARNVDLFPSWIIARHAYPNRRPQIQVLCPNCGNISESAHGTSPVICGSCRHRFAPENGTVSGANAACNGCGKRFGVLSAITATGARPAFRLYGKLVLTAQGSKQYLPASQTDSDGYRSCSELLRAELNSGAFALPELVLGNGYNTRQAISYGFRAWKDFFNDRQLLALAWLHQSIAAISDAVTRDALLLLFSGALEFNNMFASYKGEGTGAVRHMFSHHILKPERTPLEANVWGTPKSSGGFSNLFRSRLLRALEYRLAPTEINGKVGRALVCSPSFSGKVTVQWPREPHVGSRAIYLSCGDSAQTGLKDSSVSLIVSDPPFFDNVHYSELADFFYAWQLLCPRGFVRVSTSTRLSEEVQDSDCGRFESKLRLVFQECYRVLKPSGLFVFTFHQSREDGWKALARAIRESGFVAVNTHPVKSEMSVAAPKAQAREPIQLDIVVVCRKHDDPIAQRLHVCDPASVSTAKTQRLKRAGFKLSQNDHKVVLLGQLLTKQLQTELFAAR